MLPSPNASKAALQPMSVSWPWLASQNRNSYGCSSVSWTPTAACSSAMIRLARSRGFIRSTYTPVVAVACLIPGKPVTLIPVYSAYHAQYTTMSTGLGARPALCYIAMLCCLMLHCHAVLPYATLPCYCATVCLLLRGIASALPDASQAFLICHANKVFWANTAVPSHRHAYIRMTHMHCVMDDRSCSGTVSPLPCLAFMTAAVLLSSLHTFTYSLCNDALQPTTGVLKCLWPAST